MAISFKAGDLERFNSALVLLDFWKFWRMFTHANNCPGVIYE
jgi:hypothetical protein